MQITIWWRSSKYCVIQRYFDGDPQNIVFPNVYFKGDPQTIVLLKPYFHTKALRKCSEFRTKYGTSLVRILVYFS